MPFPKPAPTVSIIVNCLNGEAYLQEALDSISQQKFTDYEVIFVDNCSTDSTPVIARRFGEKLKYINTGKPVPLGLARNIAVSACSGAFLAFLDADDVWKPHKLEYQLELFSATEVVMTYSACISVDRNFRASSVLLNRSSNGRRARKLVRRTRSSLLGEYGITLSTVMLRRSVLQKLNVTFDADLTVSEETELFLRVAQHGSVVGTSERLTFYRVYGGSATYRTPWLFFLEAQVIKGRVRAAADALELEPSLRRFRLSAIWTQAYFNWLRGNNTSCRRILLRTFTGSMREWKLLLLSFFPGRAGKFLLRVMGKVTPD